MGTCICFCFWISQGKSICSTAQLIQQWSSQCAKHCVRPSIALHVLDLVRNLAWLQACAVTYAYALPCPALPCPALPCPALPCPDFSLESLLACAGSAAIWTKLDVHLPASTPA